MGNSYKQLVGLGKPDILDAILAGLPGKRLNK